MRHSLSQQNHVWPPAFARAGVVAFLVGMLLLTAEASAAEESQPAPAGAAQAAPLLVTDGLEGGRVQVLLGKSAVLTTSRPYKRVSIADPEVAVARPVGVTSVLVTPKKPGTTQLILWDDNERSQMIDVVVQLDVQVLQEQYKAMFPDAKIEVATANGAVILRGRVPDTTIAEQAVQVASPYATRVLNLLEVAGGRQVMLQVRFAEVSRSATNALGVNFGYTDGRSFGASNIGQVGPLGIQKFENEAIDLGVSAPSAGVTIFGRALIGQSALGYFIQALRQNNLLRVLAEPNLIATSGQEATFLAGGEFPIPVTQGGNMGEGSAITIEYREFGVRLRFVPVVLGNGRIRLKVAPEVSDLDFTSAVRLSGFVVPGLTTRKVSTTIELAEGQTFAIAGLLNHNVTANKDTVPILGDIPVMGALFRSVRYQRKETELVVLVTPSLVEGMSPSQMPKVPGQDWRHPSEVDLFLKTDLGGPAQTGAAPATAPAQTQSQGPAPRFYGSHGFTPVTDTGSSPAAE